MNPAKTHLTILLLLFAGLTSGCVTTKSGRSSDEDAARANMQLAAAYLRRGDVNLAMEKIDRALEQDDDLAEAHIVKGMILARAEEFDAAEDHYLRAGRLAPEDGNILSNVGMYLCQRGEHRDGERMFLSAANLPTYNRPAIALANAGLCAKRIPALERAEQHLRRALTLEPNYAPALWQMAEVSFERGELLAARAFLQRYEGVQRLGPDGLWLGILVERGLRDRAAEQRYADILLRDFPDAEQADLLRGGVNSNGDANER